MPETIQKNETTNAVLKEKIDGLKDLTNERFKNIQDALTRIEGNSMGFATKTELEEIKKDFTSTVKRIEENQVAHNAADVVSFDTMSKGQKEIRDIMLRWIGGLTVITTALPFLVKFFWG